MSLLLIAAALGLFGPPLDDVVRPKTANPYADALHGTRLAGDTVQLQGYSLHDGTGFRFQALTEVVRVVVFTEPLSSPEGVARFAWWKANSAAFKSAGASLVLVPSGGVAPAVSGVAVVSDNKARLAAHFGVIRHYAAAPGAQPLAFVLDEGGMIRAVADIGTPAAQAKKLLKAVAKLHAQLDELRTIH
jgi:hypothetical protein